MAAAAAAKEISMAVAIATVLSQVDGIFTLKEEPKNGISLWTTLFLLYPKLILSKSLGGTVARHEWSKKIKSDWSALNVTDRQFALSPCKFPLSNCFLGGYVRRNPKGLGNPARRVTLKRVQHISAPSPKPITVERKPPAQPSDRESALMLAETATCERC